ncbi:hypothetical protein [Citricoccus sp. GCM10030269]|uniref:hypothetical protein n=1 Tax=Citricoccus sp. GCM10030269 TaxID=3273388 RepID=UPI00360A9734
MALSTINAALGQIPKRAESRDEAELRSTFEDSGVSQAMNNLDDQIVYGRRGTGKTHAFRYLSSIRNDENNLPIYIDLRTVGSTDGLFGGRPLTGAEKTARLLVDLLSWIHEEIFNLAVSDEGLESDSNFVGSLDRLYDSIRTVRVIGEVETSSQRREEDAEQGTFRLDVSPHGLNVASSSNASSTSMRAENETRSGIEVQSINFAEVSKALRDLARSISNRRIWLLLDEWTSLPIEVQPYLGEFLKRCILPLPRFTVKIAAIEQQAVFQTQLSNGELIGIELGADMAANLSLDDFMVFENDQQRSREFFLGLFCKHLKVGSSDTSTQFDFRSERDLIRQGFSDVRAFDELVRAAEGVPRDAINIAANSARHAGSGAISIPHVRRASRDWYHQDKHRALTSQPEAEALLNWIVDKVIRDKKARGFLVNQRDIGTSLLTSLFEARVLHVARRGYSAQDAPGERYDVYTIDYGAYVDLIGTKNGPSTHLPLPEYQSDLPTQDEVIGDVEVPSQDLRALRRAILDVSEFTGDRLDRRGKEQGQLRMLGSPSWKPHSGGR